MQYCRLPKVIPVQVLEKIIMKWVFAIFDKSKPFFKVKRRSDEFLVFLYNYMLSSNYLHGNSLNYKSQVNCTSPSHFGVGSMKLYVQAEKKYILNQGSKVRKK